MTFDMASLRKGLDEYIILSSQQSSYAEALQNKSLDGVGNGILECCLRCMLVGNFVTAHELLPKARQFLRGAIEHGEVPRYYFHGGTESGRLNALAMCNWFIDARHDDDSLKQAVRWKELWFAEKGDTHSREVQLSLAQYLDAGEYTTLVARFEHAGIKAPQHLKNIRGEGTMAYVIARQRLGLAYGEKEVAEAIQSFLKRNVPSWLGHEWDFDATAQWMKIAFWKPGDDPIATFLKCYDYLPGIEAPAYPPTRDSA